MNYRLYTFVANHYLSPLQCGLQTAHVVGELSQMHFYRNIFERWAKVDKTIIICAAGNHKGVVDAFEQIRTITVIRADMHLPYSIFHEDEQSMNGMATACGIIVPERIYDAKEIPCVPAEFGFTGSYGFFDPDKFEWSVLSNEETELHKFLKSFRLA